MNILRILLVILLIVCALSSSVRAQYRQPFLISECDYCGCAQGISPVETGSTGARFEYTSLYLNAQYEGAKKLANPAHQYELLQTERASFYYHIDDSPLTASVEIPYVVREAQVLEDAPATTLLSSGASGLGDVIARIRYTIQEHIDETSLAYSSSFGIQFPTGRTDVRATSGGFMDPDLQPGSGSTTFLLGLSAFGSVERFGFGASATAGILTGRGAPEDSGQSHRYGNFLSGEISLRYRILPAEISVSNVSITLALGAETRARETQGGQDVPASGGSFLYLSPGIKYLISQNFAADACIHLPIYEYFHWDPVTGATQFGESHRLIAGIQYSL